VLPAVPGAPPPPRPSMSGRLQPQRMPPYAGRTVGGNAARHVLSAPQRVFQVGEEVRAPEVPVVFGGSPNQNCRCSEENVCPTEPNGFWGGGGGGGGKAGVCFAHVLCFLNGKCLRHGAAEGKASFPVERWYGTMGGMSLWEEVEPSFKVCQPTRLDNSSLQCEGSNRCWQAV